MLPLGSEISVLSFFPKTVASEWGGGRHWELLEGGGGGEWGEPDSSQKHFRVLILPRLHPSRKFWEARGSLARHGARQGKGRRLNGVGCFHLIITPADITEIRVMRIGRMGTTMSGKEAGS